MDYDSIKQLVESNRVARAAMEQLKTLERARGSNDLRRLRARMLEEKRIECSPADFREVFRELEEAGFGRLLVGVSIKGKKQENAPDRFVWGDTPSSEVARRVLAKQAPVERQSSPPRRAYTPTSAPAAPSAAVGWETIAFPLRGQIVRLTLPADLSQAEAADLAAFIQKFGR